MAQGVASGGEYVCAAALIRQLSGRRCMGECKSLSSKRLLSPLRAERGTLSGREMPPQASREMPRPPMAVDSLQMACETARRVSNLRRR